MSAATPPVIPARSRSRKRRMVLCVLGIPMLFALGLGLFAAWSLRVGGDVARLRDQLTQGNDLRFESTVGFRATWPALFVARCLFHAVDSHVPSEAASALGAVRRVDVCVGEFQGALDSDRRRRLFELGSQHLKTSGWDPVVRVIEDDEVVGVFAPQGGDSGSSIELMVLVCDGRDLVITCVRCDGNVLAELAEGAISRRKWAFLAARGPG